MTQKIYLIGSPVEHSLSPVIHNVAYQKLGLDYEFSLAEVQPQQLQTFLRQLSPDVAGLAVTMPLKHLILPFLDAIEPMAAALQVVNTVAVTGNLLTGFNTDVYGIRSTLEKHPKFLERVKTQSVNQVVILGSGATAVSTMMAVAELGIKNFTIIARSFTRPPSIMKIAATLGITPQLIPLKSRNRALQEIMKAKVVISTVPSKVLFELVQNLQNVNEKIILNIDYAADTSLLEQYVNAQGGYYVRGTEVLLNQAVSQFNLHTGKNAPVTTMRVALDAALTKRN